MVAVRFVYPRLFCQLLMSSFLCEYCVESRVFVNGFVVMHVVIAFADVVCIEFLHGVYIFPLFVMCSISVVFSVVPCIRLCFQYVL
jgi:hypothetical protein